LIFAALLLTVCIGAPVVEMFDRWDNTLQDGNDTESNVVIAVVCVGIGFVAAAASLARVRPSLNSTLLRLPVPAFVALAERAHIPSIPYASPPTVLRV
jgi:hypothetical protein